MISNYGRFYSLFNRLYCGYDKDEAKCDLVSSFTDGRTTSLREMTDAEYNAMCHSLEERTGWKEQLKKARSLCLKLMQKAGVDTTDWQRINDFCQNPKIAGKVFARLGVKELEALQVKLRAIMRKGGLKKEATTVPQHREPSERGNRSVPTSTAHMSVLIPVTSYGEA